MKTLLVAAFVYFGLGGSETALPRQFQACLCLIEAFASSIATPGAIQCSGKVDAYARTILRSFAPDLVMLDIVR